MTPPQFRAAVAEILDIAPGALKDSDTRDTLENWTSLADVQIMAMVQSEFGIEPEPEFLESETFGEMRQWLQSRGAFGA